MLNRRGADARRERLLASYPTKHGYDRNEYPPVVGRGRGRGLERGVNRLEGITIGRLAGELAMSKSGLIGRFGDKETMQRAVLAAAIERFTDAV